MSSSINVRSSYGSRARWRNTVTAPGKPFTSRFPGICAGCTQPIVKGQRIYSKGKGRTFHDRCREIES
jgi:hypothetical protein